MQRFVYVAALVICLCGFVAVNMGLADTPGVLTLPAPVEWATAPVGAPTAPGDAYSVTFADPSGSVNPSAPAIAEWNRTVKPGESFVVTGDRLTSRSGADAGTDTTVWVWAWTTSGGTLRQAKIWHVDDNEITATLPDDIPFGMYLVWVENSAGPSAPFCINRPVAQWIGPLGNAASPGEKRRVFGKNISYLHGSATSYAYIQPAAGGPLTAMTVSKVEPFDVEFTIPDDTPNGNYKIYVHNGHGGQYGWSDPLTLTVQSLWVRGTTEAALSPAPGGDDTTAINNAINSMAALPNGGTVRLSSGTFTVKNQIVLKGKVRLIGAGMNSTTIAVRLVSVPHDAIGFQGDHITIQDMTWTQFLSTGHPDGPNQGGFTGGMNGYTMNDAKLVNVRMNNEFGVYYTRASLGGDRCEISGCELYGMTGTWTDGWTHDNNLYSGPLSSYEAASGGYTRNVFEHNYVATPIWPYDPTNATPYNYLAPGFVLDPGPIGAWAWSKRVFLAQYNTAVPYQYIGWTTSNNVAVEDNRGEIILLHGNCGAWFGQCLSTVGTTTTVRTDGLIDGQVVTVYNDQTPFGTTLTGGQPVPTNFWYLTVDGYCYMTITAGAGMGQCRKVVSHTSNTITVDKPWRLPPDSTSKAVLSEMYSDFIIYKNDLNAFPLGYVQDQTASCMAQLSGGWGIELEGNTSRRTYGGIQWCGNSVSPSAWCTSRDNQVLDSILAGLNTGQWSFNPVGFENLGNRMINCKSQAKGTADNIMLYGCEANNIMEGCVGSGGTQGIKCEGEALFRNNSLTLSQTSGTVGTYVGVSTDNPTTPLLIGGTYIGATQTYSTSLGCTFAQKPVPEYRVAKFSGFVGQPVGHVVVPVANAGIAAMTWTAVPSDSWISASVVSGPTAAAEAETGRMVVGVDTTGMSAGRHWGYVDINSGATTARVGVCVDLASGSGNLAPSASFTTTPSGGTIPLNVTMDASASVDVDGSIISYVWDFGDGTIGSGTVVTHTYSNPGIYAPTLVVTDDAGATDTAFATITVAPALASVTLSGSPNPPVSSGASVTLTGTPIGGYLVQYKFVVNNGTGWNTIRDYASGNTCNWTPIASGYYRLKVYARNTGSTAAYDAASGELGYPAGLLPSTGMTFWLRGEVGVNKDSGLKVSSWADQSSVGNNASQSFSAYRPTYKSDSGNCSPAVTFATGNVILNTTSRVITGTSEFTCFVLLKYNGAAIPASNEFVFWNGIDNSATGGYGIWLDSSSHLAAGWGLYNARLTDTDALVGGQWYVFTTRYGGGSHQIWVNGTAKGSTSKSNSNMSSGGGSVGNKGPAAYQGFDGDIQEMIVYNRALTDTERAGVESYLATKYQPQVKTSIPAVKSLADGTIVTLTGAKSATVSSGTFTDGGYYIEEPDRSSGMRLVGQAGLPAVSVGDTITVTGSVGTDLNGEKALYLSGISSQVAGVPLGCLGMANKAVVQGLLVKVWGKVKEKTDTYLTVDDGSGTTVRVRTDGLVTPLTSIPDVGAYISATGPAGMMSGVPTVRVTTDTDIQIY